MASPEQSPATTIASNATGVALYDEGSVRSQWDPEVTKRVLRKFGHDHAVSVAATCAAVVGVLSGYPFDSVKTRMQAFRYSSMVSCIRDTYRMEGMQGFFRGVVPVMVSVAALRSLSFTLYTNGKKEILDRMARDGSGAPSSQLSKIALASSCSGMVTGFIVAALNAPIEFIKLQKQLERLTLAASSTVIDEQTAPNLMKTTPNPTGTTTGSGGSTGIKFGSVGKYMAESASGRTAAAAATAAAQGGDFKAVLQGVPSRPTVGPTLQQKTFESSSTWGWTKRIVRMKGVRGLYGGAHLHLLRDGLGTAMYFGGYEVAKHMLIPVLGNGPIVHILAGGFAGTSCWLVLFPIDLTKSVIQRDYLRPNPRYRSTMEFLRSAWRKGGIRRFYSGIGPQLLRSFPVHALNFLVYEHVLKMCKELGDDEGDLQLGSSTGVPSGTPLMSSLKPQDSGPG